MTIQDAKAQTAAAKDEAMSAADAAKLKNWLRDHGWSGKTGELARLNAARKRRGDDSTPGAAKIVIEEFHGKVLAAVERITIHDGKG